MSANDKSSLKLPILSGSFTLEKQSSCSSKNNSENNSKNNSEKINDTYLAPYVRHNDINNVKKLLENNRNPNMTDSIGNSCIYNAIQNDNFDILKLLIEAGGDINKKSGTLDLSPLNQACWFSEYEIIKYLLELGADVNATDLYCNTPLHNACHRGKSVKIIKLLLKHGANPNLKNRDGLTPRGVARNGGFHEIVESI